MEQFIFSVRAHLNAVRELSMLASELSDGDMIQIAQAASMRTAVGLAARCQNPDPRQVKSRIECLKSASLMMLFKFVMVLQVFPEASSFAWRGWVIEHPPPVPQGFHGRPPSHLVIVVLIVIVRIRRASWQRSRPLQKRLHTSVHKHGPPDIRRPGMLNISLCSKTHSR